MDADGVDVLDRAHDDDVVLVVAHELELVLLPPEDRLLEEDLGGDGVGEAGTGDAAQIGLVIRHARSESAHREGGADDEGVAELLGAGDRLVEGVADDGAGHLGAAVLDDLLELLPVLAALDRVDVGADELDAVLLQRARLVEGDRGVERGLPAEGRQDRVGALLGDDRLDDVGVDGLDVGGVGDVGVGHDRRGVGVDEDDAQAL
ncbi:Uncharacterised protein [Mycobacteroides abscessus subsp. abscessus]|nr:Uncharacterised protein [Mycobacteroides abscessus subsp. abscessus]